MTMGPVFSLGIRPLWAELSHMPAGGIWWINTDRKQDALSLLNATLAEQAPDARCAAVVMDKTDLEQITLAANSGPGKVSLFTMPGQIKALQAFSSDLIRNINPEHFFIILLLSEKIFENVNNSELVSWLTITSRWTNAHHASLLVLNPGNSLGKQTARLMGEYPRLSGLADLHYQSDQHRYSVQWWCSDKGIAGRSQVPVTHTENGWEVLTSTDTPPQSYTDDQRILCQTDVLEGAPAFSEHWVLFSTSNALFEAARSASAATVIFSLSQVGQVERVARAVHSLRLQRGSALKLVIREKNPCLRATDERLLLGCGANMVIPWTITLSRSLAMIDAIKSQVFHQHVPRDFDQLINSVRPLSLKGLQPWETFCRAINDLLNNPLIAFDSKGVLVAMRPVAGLRAEQALTLCRPNRTGDIMTIGHGQIFLFLSFCLINDLDKALSRIFPFPVADIIANRTVWYEDKNIAAQLVEMGKSSLGQLNQPLPQTSGSQDAMNIHYNEQGWRREPQPVTLLTGNPQDP
ncbi:hypothetical protein YhjS [Shimwellia blattae DSM 4481 = NBRC 105725]|nr:hypothetical protein YhjS [Shimwellia blattae DSM 4481 = NBRC 105725]